MLINMYDEENVDIEEQINNRVLQEEIEKEQEELEILNTEASSLDVKKEDEYDAIEYANLKVNKNTILYECSLEDKKKRTLVFAHKLSNTVFEGIVIGYDKNTDKFVFKVKQYKTKENPKIRIFKYQDLKNIRYK